ncbi:MAG: flagellar biosynthetic protein FliR [Candidatus Caenarcaniphilales bacterium]|nr:flagellar biosynthetic protein FliR [Candidatus Caenarcaniphilales bacterium]
MLIFARVLGFTHLFPAFPQRSFPILVKVAMSLLIAVIISPIVPAAPTDMNSYNFFLSLGLNVLAGMFVAFLTRLVLDIIQVAGEVMDNQLGLNAVSLFDPNLGQTTTLSLFFNTFGIVMFLYVGGLELTLISFVKSFELFPLTAIDFSTFKINMLQVVSLTQKVITFGIIGASPIILVTLFMDIVLGLMSRAAQQINPFSISFSLKPLVGVLVIILTLPFMKARFVELILEGVKVF